MSEDTTGWAEIVGFLASEFGISLNKKSDNYLGWLRMSQVESLIEGFSKLKQKESDAVKRSSNPGRFQATEQNIHNVPGVVVKNKKK